MATNVMWTPPPRPLSTHRPCSSPSSRFPPVERTCLLRPCLVIFPPPSLPPQLAFTAAVPSRLPAPPPERSLTRLWRYPSVGAEAKGPPNVSPCLLISRIHFSGRHILFLSGACAGKVETTARPHGGEARQSTRARTSAGGPFPSAFAPFHGPPSFPSHFSRSLPPFPSSIQTF